MSIIIESRQSIVMSKKSGIFAVAARAKKRIQEVGEAGVINSTLGNGADENGKPFLIPTFLKVLEELLASKPEVLCGYTPPGGLPPLNETYPRYILQGVEMPPDIIIRSIPTHGGSGALSLSIANMCSKSVISHFPYWPNYNLITRQHGKKIQGFNLHDEKLALDMDSFAKIIKKVSGEENRLFLMINSPYSNPTGSSINDDEWIEMGKELSRYRIPKTLVLDLAYIDFGQGGKNPKALRFLPGLLDADKELTIVLAPSASKSFMAYGWRLGAAILLSRDRSEADLWYNVMEGTVRGSNSNNTTAPQQALANIFADMKLVKKVEMERQLANEVVQSRFKIFSEASKDAGIKISKPEGGYFTMVYAKEPARVAEVLEKRDIFTVPIANPEGLRISICSLKKEECRRLPIEIAKVI